MSRYSLHRSFWQPQRVLVTGGAGFLGTHLVNLLRQYQPKEIRVPRSGELDLRQPAACRKALQDIDLVIHLAANVGGIGYNQKYPATLFYDNLLMGVHLLEQARLAGVKKFVGIGTICAYPKFTPVPFKEEDLWNGYPEETNAPYGLAKKMLLVQGQAMRAQYDFPFIYLLPTNLYGPGDNFDLASSHVIPALIRRLATAKDNSEPDVVIWGTGRPTREFLYVADAARGIALAAEHYHSPEPVNLGSSQPITIANLARQIAAAVGYTGRLKFDPSKPDGQPKRHVDTSRAKESFGFSAATKFPAGLKKTVEFYRREYTMPIK
jgi:GDP-L-fucose synthase